MAARIRPYEASDYEAYCQVRQYVYNGGAPIAADAKPILDDTLPSVGEVNGRIVAACNALSMNVTRGGADLRCAGVAAVGVRPEYRSTGVGADLMRGVLPYYREQGFHVSALYPFKGAFYRGFGYEFGGRILELKLPSHKFPKVESTMPVRIVDYADRDLLRPCYETFARQYAGVNLRREEQWWRHLGRDNPYTLYAAGDPIEGYALVRLIAGFWEDQEVQEFVWTTPESYRALLALFRSLGINQNHIKWYEPVDSPFMAQFDEYGLDAKADWPRIMWRAIHVPEALRRLKPEASGEVRLEVADELVPANRGPWHVRFSPDGVEVEACGQADVKLDIRPFSQALMGEPSAERSLALGRICASSKSAAKSLCDLLPATKVYCIDFF